MANKLLKSITFPDLTDKYIVGDTSLSVSGAAADAKATGDALGTKANADGYYENLTAGSANQLLSTVTIEDKVPYQFRTSGGSADIGDRETDMLVGGTIAWNQLMQTRSGTFTHNGVTYVMENGIVTATVQEGGVVDGTSYIAVPNPDPTFIKGHVYYFLGCPSGGGWYGGTANRYMLDTGAGIGNDVGNGIMAKYNGDTGSKYVRIYFGEGATAGTYVFKPQLFDLTQMFGSTIADYIHSLNQATAGAGMAWFRKLFPKPFYELDLGTLKSVEGVSSHDMVGFNAWDEEWENGFYSVQTGEKVANNNYIRSKNYIPVIPNTSYYFKTPNTGIILYYDADRNYIGTYENYFKNAVFTTPSNCGYLAFFIDSGYGTTYNHDICINLSWDGERDGEYEPYVKQSYPLDDSLTLRGIPKLDSANSLYYDGDIYESDGTVTRKYGIVDLGAGSWDREGNYYKCPVANIKRQTDMSIPIKALCSAKYAVYAQSDSNRTGNITGLNWYDGIMYWNDGTITTVAEMKTAMNGVYLVYELATPTTETADPYQHVQIVNDFGTEEYVSTSIVPVGHYTEYQPNLRAKLEMAPNSPNDGDGDYIVRQSNGENTYVKLVIPQELPTTPSENGTYSLKVTVSDGTATLSWEA